MAWGFGADLPSSKGRYEAEGPAGLLDRRLGKVSPHRIAADEVERIVALYRDRYAGWTVKHFHERASERHGLKASYGWTKSVLHASGLVRPAPRRSAHRKKRPRRPLPGLMLHQDGSRHLWVPALELQLDIAFRLPAVPLLGGLGGLGAGGHAAQFYLFRDIERGVEAHLGRAIREVLPASGPRVESMIEKLLNEK